MDVRPLDDVMRSWHVLERAGVEIELPRAVFLYQVRSQVSALNT